MLPILILVIIVVLVLLVESDTHSTSSGSSKHLPTSLKRAGNHFIDLIYQPKSAGKPKPRSLFPYANWQRKSKRPRKKSSP